MLNWLHCAHIHVKLHQFLLFCSYLTFVLALMRTNRVLLTKYRAACCMPFASNLVYHCAICSYASFLALSAAAVTSSCTNGHILYMQFCLLYFYVLRIPPFFPCCVFEREPWKLIMTKTVKHLTMEASSSTVGHGSI